jgi:hypothetical protein
MAGTPSSLTVLERLEYSHALMYIHRAASVVKSTKTSSQVSCIPRGLGHTQMAYLSNHISSRRRRRKMEFSAIFCARNASSFQLSTVTAELFFFFSSPSIGMDDLTRKRRFGGNVLWTPKTRQAERVIARGFEVVDSLLRAHARGGSSATPPPLRAGKRTSTNRRRPRPANPRPGAASERASGGTGWAFLPSTLVTVTPSL